MQTIPDLLDNGRVLNFAADRQAALVDDLPGNAARCFIDCLPQVIRRHARSARKEELARFTTVSLPI